jgi:hypothetical protein
MSAGAEETEPSREFDVSAESAEWYRFRRFGRWLALAVVIGVAGALGYRLFFGVSSPLLYVGLAAVVVVLGFGVRMVVWSMAPGPTRLLIQGNAARFDFQGGRSLSLTRKEAAQKLEFLSPLSPESQANERGYRFAVRLGLTVFAITSEAHAGLTAWMERAGYARRERTGSFAGKGSRSVRYRPG